MNFIQQTSGRDRLKITPGPNRLASVVSSVIKLAILRARLVWYIYNCPEGSYRTDTERMSKILLVEDDQDLSDMISGWLKSERYTVEVAYDGDIAREILKISSFDVVVLDWDLPGCSGIEILREFRANGGSTPVIMLTGKSTITDKETGLDIGADDYLTKPFNIKELGARVKALLRRPTLMNSSVLRAGDIELDSSKHRILRGGQEVHLLPRDFALLEFLLRHKDQVFSAEALIARVWESDSDASPEGLRTAIKRIRKKIDDGTEDDQSLIENIPRVGYRLRSSR